MFPPPGGPKIQTFLSDKRYDLIQCMIHVGGKGGKCRDFYLFFLFYSDNK